MRLRSLLALACLVVAACSSLAPAADPPPTRAPVAAVDPPAEPPVLPATVGLEMSGQAEPSKAVATAIPTKAPCRLPGRVLAHEFPSNIAGQPFRYRVYLPPCYGLDGRTYPTLYIFGGNIHDERFWDEAGLDEAAEAAIQAGRMAPLLIVMPEGGWVANNTSGGPYSYEALVLEELIPHVEDEYCAWQEPAGRAIGGLSRGGYWSLEIAFRHPEQFASVGGHSASLIDYAAGPDLSPQYTPFNNDLGELRIYLDIGERDYLRAGLEALHEQLAAAQIPHDWTLNEGQHVDSYWAEHASDYLTWYAAPWAIARDAYPLCQIDPDS